MKQNGETFMWDKQRRLVLRNCHHRWLFFANTPSFANIRSDNCGSSIVRALHFFMERIRPQGSIDSKDVHRHLLSPDACTMKHNRLVCSKLECLLLLVTFTFLDKHASLLLILRIHNVLHFPGKKFYTKQFITNTRNPLLYQVIYRLVSSST